LLAGKLKLKYCAMFCSSTLSKCRLHVPRCWQSLFCLVLLKNGRCSHSEGVS